MEEEKIIVVQFRFTRRSALLALTALFLCWHPRFLGSEQLTLTTYYPAPYGGYASLLTTGQTLLARDGGQVGIGTSATAAKLDVWQGDDKTDNPVGIRIYRKQSNGNPTLQFSDGGSANSIQMTAGSYNLAIAPVQGNVGIGTENPAYLLDVDGPGRVSEALYANKNAYIGQNAYAGGDIRVGYGAGADIGDLYVNGYIKTFCTQVGYSYTKGATTCPSSTQFVGFRPSGVAVFTGFLPASAEAWSNKQGKYVSIGGDWSGTMVCCKVVWY